ncbi:MAG TPA: hypothetical protein VL359_15580 [bacterium]|nr:hypothetical protein [bacterium]
MRLLLLLTVLLLGCACAVQAQSTGPLLRLYYGADTVGTISKSPQDPRGDYTGSKVNQDNLTELELILAQRVGISAGQQYVVRSFLDSAGNALDENWYQTFYCLTLYLREVQHDRFNVFLGAGAGTVERYQASVNGQTQPSASADREIPLQRVFGGVEYTFDRIGFRLEVAETDAEQSSGGQKVQLNQTYQTLLVYIPFN